MNNKRSFAFLIFGLFLIVVGFTWVGYSAQTKVKDTWVSDGFGDGPYMNTPYQYSQVKLYVIDHDSTYENRLELKQMQEAQSIRILQINTVYGDGEVVAIEVYYQERQETVGTVSVEMVTF